MNYGFNRQSDGWKPRRKRKLADALTAMLGGYLAKRTLPISHGSGPYVEVDGLYGGVRLRSLTWLTEPEIDLLVAEAERVYREVMGLPFAEETRP